MNIVYGVGAFIAAVVLVVAVTSLSGNNDSGNKKDGAANGGDEIPEKNEIPEKTIWAYQEDSKLSDFQKLCKDTIEKHKGEFTVRSIQKDTGRDLVKSEYLPANWEELDPKYQKDTVMNALLYQYGGVALDLNTVMFHSLDKWWDDMEKKKAAFKSFYAKSRSEASTWFMMAPKGGKVSKAIVERQVKKSTTKPSGCPVEADEKKLCYGSHMVSFGLCKISEEYCRCYASATEDCELTALEQEDKDEDVKLDVESNARKTVLSPVWFGKAPKLKELEWMPFADVTEKTEEWEDFENRYKRGGMPFITMQDDLGKDVEKTKDNLLKDQDTFFYRWLCLAHHSEIDADKCAGPTGSGTTGLGNASLTRQSWKSLFFLA